MSQELHQHSAKSTALDETITQMVSATANQHKLIGDDFIEGRITHTQYVVATDLLWQELNVRILSLELRMSLAAKYSASLNNAR